MPIITELLQLAEEVKYLGYSSFSNYHYERENYPTEKGWLNYRSRMSKRSDNKLVNIMNRANELGDIEVAFNVGRELFKREQELLTGKNTEV